VPTGFAAADPGLGRDAAGRSSVAAARSGKLSFLSVIDEAGTGHGGLAACRAGLPGEPDIIRPPGGGA
jgi:hypothetical protein